MITRDQALLILRALSHLETVVIIDCEHSSRVEWDRVESATEILTAEILGGKDE